MGLGFAVFAGTSPEVIRASAREAERLGYSSFWVNHPGPTDGLAALALAARDTQRIELGIGVIPLHTRGPESIVQGVKTTGLPLDRLLLVVGCPNPEALKRVRPGVSAENPDDDKRGLAKWQGAIDEVVIRAITAKDTVEDHLALVRAAAPV